MLILKIIGTVILALLALFCILSGVIDLFVREVNKNVKLSEKLFMMILPIALSLVFVVGVVALWVTA